MESVYKNSPRIKALILWMLNIVDLTKSGKKDDRCKCWDSYRACLSAFTRSHARQSNCEKFLLRFLFEETNAPSV